MPRDESKEDALRRCAFHKARITADIREKLDQAHYAQAEGLKDRVADLLEDINVHEQQLLAVDAEIGEVFDSIPEDELRDTVKSLWLQLNRVREVVR